MPRLLVRCLIRQTVLQPRNALTEGKERRLGSICQVQLGEYPPNMDAGSSLGNKQPVANVLIRQTLGNQFEHLYLALGEGGGGWRKIPGFVHFPD